MRTLNRSGFRHCSRKCRRNQLEPPCTDPYARWCGRGRRVTAAPMPIHEPAGAKPVDETNDVALGHQQMVRQFLLTDRALLAQPNEGVKLRERQIILVEVGGYPGFHEVIGADELEPCGKSVELADPKTLRRGQTVLRSTHIAILLHF
jgi:hypothetical protein